MPGPSAKDLYALLNARFADGGEVDIAEQMTVGTIPEDMREPGKAEEAFRALVEAGQGFLGLEPGRRGTESYRTGQALSNLPVLALPAAAVKGTGKLKNLTKKDIKAIAGELETSRGQLAEITKKYPQIKEASVGEVETLTKGEPFTAYRGISLLPGRELRSETMPSTSLDPNVALRMIKDAPVMMTKEGFITSTPVLRQYPGMKASETEVYVPSLIEQVKERQPGALEMKIPTRGGEKMSLADIFEAVQGEKELLADLSKKSPKDILFNRYQGGVGDRYLMEVARKVLEGEWKGGEALVKEIGGYQSDPTALVKEFDDFAEMVKSTVLKKAQGGEVSTTDFIRKRQAGSPPEAEVPTDDYIQQMTGDVVRSASDFGPEMLQMMRKERLDPRTLQRVPLPKGSPYTATAGLPGLRAYVDPELTGTDTAGYVFGDAPPSDTSMFLRKDRLKDTVGHEAEHLLAAKQLGHPTEINSLFDSLVDNKKQGDRVRSRFVRDAVDAYPYLKEKYGLQSAYFDPRMYDFQKKHGAAQNLLFEQLATLSAIEVTQNVDLTKDSELRKTLFRDKEVREIYGALTGLRQTRLDSKDIRPHTRIPETEPSLLDRARKSLGFAAGGEVTQFIKAHA